MHRDRVFASRRPAAQTNTGSNNAIAARGLPTARRSPPGAGNICLSKKRRKSMSPIIFFNNEVVS